MTEVTYTAKENQMSLEKFQELFKTADVDPHEIVLATWEGGPVIINKESDKALMLLTETQLRLYTQLYVEGAFDATT
jgi:hypothetical protein